MEHARQGPADRRPALVLLGPTGSGKTPLGELIEKRGLWGQQCAHFDFGAQLRDIVQRNSPDRLVSQQDIDFLRRVINSGVLLEDQHFPLAERILSSFMAKYAADGHTCIVLNGLPRHVGQALALENLLDVRGLVYLQCSGRTVLQRLRTNVGGDRQHRADDDFEAVEKRLRIYRTRTAPVLDHYRNRGTCIEILAVTPQMTPEDMWAAICSRR